MNMLQALGVAAAGLGMALFSSSACAERHALSRISIRATFTEVVATLEQSQLCQKVAERYAAHLPDSNIHNRARL